MSYSIDVNILVYASNSSDHHRQHQAVHFLNERFNDPDLFCLTWITLMSYQRIATHSSIFPVPLTPQEAWKNIEDLLSLPQVRIIGEEHDFAEYYAQTTASFPVRGNLVPDAHLATLLRHHGVNKLYSVDSDFRKFKFLKVINPFE